MSLRPVAVILRPATSPSVFTTFVQIGRQNPAKMTLFWHGIGAEHTSLRALMAYESRIHPNRPCQEGSGRFQLGSESQSSARKVLEGLGRFQLC